MKATLSALTRQFLLCVGYLLAGRVGLLLVFPPDYAAPFWPAAGVALAGILLLGSRVWLGIWVGSFALQIWVTYERYGELSSFTCLRDLGIGFGAAAQALVGGRLTRWVVGFPSPLIRSRDVFAFLLAVGPMACVINAGLSTTLLYLTGAIAWSNCAISCLTWWVGDTIGVLLVAPVLLCLWGEPRALWQPRLLKVAVPTVVMSAVVVLICVLAQRHERNRMSVDLRQEIARTVAGMKREFGHANAGFRVWQNYLSAGRKMQLEELDRAAQSRLEERPGIRCFGISKIFLDKERDAYEAGGLKIIPGFRFTERAPNGSLVRAPRRQSYNCLIFLHPRKGAESILGLDLSSEQSLQEPLAKARDLNQPIQMKFPLTVKELYPPNSALMVLPIFQTGLPSSNSEERLASLSGFALAVYDLSAMLEQVTGDMADQDVSIKWTEIEKAEGNRRSVPEELEWTASGCQSLVSVELGMIPIGLKFTFGLKYFALAPTGYLMWIEVLGFAFVALVSAVSMLITGETALVSEEVKKRTEQLEVEITHRRQTEEALRSSEERYRDLFENANDLIQCVNSNEKFVYVNQAWQTVLGYQPEEITSLTIWDIVHPESREHCSQLFAQIKRGEISELNRLEASFRTKDGRKILVEGTISASFVEGQFQHTRGIYRDVTERKQAEETTQLAREEAERANKAKSEFLSRMSHELRTPLNAVLGFAQLLELDEILPHQQNYVEQILIAGKHLLSLIDEVLDLAKVESERCDFSLESVSVRELFDEIQNLIFPLAEARGIQFKTLLCEGADYYLLADRKRITQVLLNLVSNAVKYNKEQGSVTLWCEEIETNRLRLSVSDVGPGIPPEKLHRLFTPFERLGAEAGGVQGTGLGLALSKQVTEKMGGQMGVVSQLGEGSTFWVELPKSVRPEKRLVAPKQPRKALTVPSGDQQSHTILYVEDDLVNLTLVELILASRPGVKFLSASNGTQALELARLHRPALVLLDVHLPDMHGDEWLHRAKADPQLRNIPVVALSADATSDQITRLRLAGAVDYLTKPLDVHRVLAVVDQFTTNGTTEEFLPSPE